MFTPTKRIVINCGCLLFIVAFFTAIFYPVFSELRENTRVVSCDSNLKALEVGFYQYSQDNDQAMPNVSDNSNRNTWREALFSYVRSKKAYHCPERDDALDQNGFSQNYAANDSGADNTARPNKGKGALGGPNSAPVLCRDIPTPSKLILLTEVENNPRPDFDIDDPLSFGPQKKVLWAGHFRRRSSLLFVDGHVKNSSPDLTYLYDPKNKSLFNFWYRNTDTRLSANGVAVLADSAKRFR